MCALPLFYYRFFGYFVGFLFGFLFTCRETFSLSEGLSFQPRLTSPNEVVLSFRASGRKYDFRLSAGLGLLSSGIFFIPLVIAECVIPTNRNSFPTRWYMYAGCPDFLWLRNSLRWYVLSFRLKPYLRKRYWMVGGFCYPGYRYQTGP